MDSTPWPDVLDLLERWAKSPPPGEAIVGALKASGFEWKTMDQPTKHIPSEPEKLDPAQMAIRGIKTFDMLPPSVQQLMYDYKHHPEKLGIKPN